MPKQYYMLVWITSPYGEDFSADWGYSMIASSHEAAEKYVRNMVSERLKAAFPNIEDDCNIEFISRREAEENYSDTGWFDFPDIKIVSYSGRYPNLCHGVLKLRINKKLVSLENILTSGGQCGIDSKTWESHVTQAPWRILDRDWGKVPDWVKPYKDDILHAVNKNIPYGCCGGCI